MEKNKYIYGASIQGIQGFIFSTNSLKDVVGGSELVEKVCTTLFESTYEQGGTSIIKAAGNIKCVYDNLQECEKTVLEFPKTVMLTAPGITISQAVVKVTEEEFKANFASCMDQLEKKLKIQRNRPSKSMTVGFMGVERSRTTGLPAVTQESQEYLDEGTLKKRNLSIGGKATITLAEKSFGIKELSPKNIALDIKDLTGENDWIAIIHADGNGLGQILSKFSGSPKEFERFSTNLNQATCQAAHAAFKKVYTAENYRQDSSIFPFRPVVLGGDDMTMICKASLALDYVKVYLEEFENATKQKLGAENGLTACAGIAFIKSSYPFHYGYDLAETLCTQAKIVESYPNMILKEKTPQKGLSFNFGPYFLHQTEEYWTIEDLKDAANQLNGKEGNVAKTSIRKWMTAMHQNTEMAKQAANRSYTMLSASTKGTFQKAITPQKRTLSEDAFYPAADLLDLNTILTQKTKEG